MFDLNAGLSVNSTEQKTLRVLMSLFFGRYMYASNVKKKPRLSSPSNFPEKFEIKSLRQKTYLLERLNWRMYQNQLFRQSLVWRHSSRHYFEHQMPPLHSLTQWSRSRSRWPHCRRPCTSELSGLKGESDPPEYSNTRSCWNTSAIVTLLLTVELSETTFYLFL